MELEFLVPTAIMLTGIAALIGVLKIARHRQRRPDRRSPLTEGLLRPPGQTLRDRLVDTQWDVAAYMAVAMALPPVLYATFLQHRLSGKPTTSVTIVIYLLVGAATFGVVAYRVSRAIQSVRSQTLGLEAEMAAAEEINRLMQRGYSTFHDVPGGKDFNIDHVIVGPTGVYAVETKGRPKKARGAGRAGSTVRYDGKALQFPAWRETKPLQQSIANVQWLGTWLSKAVGEPVTVRPVVLLPGWWVERVGRGEVSVGNAKEIPQIVARGGQSAEIPENFRNRIVHQLDQRCRNVEPKAYAEM